MDIEIPWNLTTNWEVALGSLHSSLRIETTPQISYETSIDEDPLVLEPSQEPEPCEVTISFKQRHVIERVYVCSTARVYEIYYGTDQNNVNEYLCTVRCGVVSREKESVQPIEGRSSSDCSKFSTEFMESPIEPTKNDIQSADEDSWVEVKVRDSIVLEEVASSGSKKSGEKGCKSELIFYEAAAEISDAEPCMCLKLRLLSLQDKASVCIEDISVTAEPVQTIEAESPPRQMESSAGSLLAMLVPSLLQLRGTGFTRMQSKPFSDVRGRQEFPESPSRATESIAPVRKMANGTSSTQPEAQEERHKEQAGNQHGRIGPELGEQITLIYDTITHKEQADDENVHRGSEAGRQVPLKEISETPNAREINADGTVQCERLSDRSYFEHALEQLSQRVDKIEAFCSRVEESMWKPLGIMETRLQQIEQKLEDLSLAHQSSLLHSNPGTAAHEASSSASNSDSPSVSGNPNHINNGISPINQSFYNGDDHDVSHVDNVNGVVDIGVRSSDGVDGADGFDVHASVGSSDGNGTCKELVQQDAVDVSDEIVLKPRFSIDDALVSALTAFSASACASTEICSEELDKPTLNCCDDRVENENPGTTDSCDSIQHQEQEDHCVGCYEYNGLGSDSTSVQYVSQGSMVSSPCNSPSQNGQDRNLSQEQWPDEVDIDMACTVDVPGCTSSEINDLNYPHGVIINEPAPSFSLLDVEFTSSKDFQGGISLEALLGDFSVNEGEPKRDFQGRLPLEALQDERPASEFNKAAIIQEVDLFYLEGEVQNDDRVDKLFFTEDQELKDVKISNLFFIEDEGLQDPSVFSVISQASGLNVDQAIVAETFTSLI
ncbi:hypothetical protein AMTRI_Chr03g45450 [Amborella trichopoda]